MSLSQKLKSMWAIGYVNWLDFDIPKYIHISKYHITHHKIYVILFVSYSTFNSTAAKITRIHSSELTERKLCYLISKLMKSRFGFIIFYILDMLKSLGSKSRGCGNYDNVKWIRQRWIWRTALLTLRQKTNHLPAVCLLG